MCGGWSGGEWYNRGIRLSRDSGDAMTDEDKPPPAGYVWMEIDGRQQLVAIGWKAAVKMIAHETITSGLTDVAAENARLRNELRYRQVIEKYNRAHGQNPKITLKEICAREGVSYDAVRQFRSRERKRKTRK